MKFVVINGSPKGELSLSMQYFKYFEKVFKDVQFEQVHVAKIIKRIDKNESVLLDIVKQMEDCDGIFWGFGVYHYTVPAQLKRFIELLYPHKKKFKNKPCSYLTTSIHFYDTMARDYITAVSEDLGFNVITGYLSGMHDLLKPKSQEMLKQFMQRFIHAVKNDLTFSKKYPKIKKLKKSYTSNNNASLKTSKKNIVMIYDNFNNVKNLEEMVKSFENNLPNKITTINLSDLSIKGGCLGCLSCGYDGKCVYKDDLIDIHTKTLLEADSIIIAGDIVGRYFSSRMKTFWDRSFLHGHRPVLKNKQLLYIISGDLLNNPIITQEIEARVDVFESNLVGIISDNDKSQTEIDDIINSYSKELMFNLEQKTKKPKSFWGVSGHVIFRDFVYVSRGIFRADHLFYKKNFHYNFPQRKKIERYINIALSRALGIENFRKKFQKNVTKMMIVKAQKEINKM